MDSGSDRVSRACLPLRRGHRPYISRMPQVPRTFPAAAGEPAPPGPLAFTAATRSLLAARPHPDAIVAEAAAPTRIAPYTAAVSIDIAEQATGRLVYLHDPDGQAAWGGCDRLVAFARVQVDAAMAADPMLSDVVWDWLAEGLAAEHAALDGLGGTVTTTASTRYGSLEQVDTSHEVELRCSWSPRTGSEGSVDGVDLGRHLVGFVATVAAMCGLPPASVVPLDRRRVGR